MYHKEAEEILGHPGWYISLHFWPNWLSVSVSIFFKLFWQWWEKLHYFSLMKMVLTSNGLVSKQPILDHILNYVYVSPGFYAGKKNIKILWWAKPLIILTFFSELSSSKLLVKHNSETNSDQEGVWGTKILIPVIFLIILKSKNLGQIWR